MKYSPADIIRYYIASTSVCSLPQSNLPWPGFTNYLPNTVNDAILFTDTNGPKDGRYMRTGKVIEHPGLQVLVRGTDQLTAWQRIEIISKIFEATVRQTVTIGSSQYLLLAVHRRGSIIPLSTEEHYKALERQTKEIKLRNFMFVLNTICSIEADIDDMLLPESVNGLSHNPFWHTQNPIGVLDGTNKVFTITTIPVNSIAILTIDGIVMSGYTISGTAITFTTAPIGSVMILTYIGE